MLFRARATLEDRPGALAALAEGCGRSGVNILGLVVFPVSGGGVVDEVVLDAPDAWDEAAVRGLLTEAGGSEVCLTRCTVHVLQDEPTRYLRAAARLVDEPDRLAACVEELLGCEGGRGSLVRGWAPLTDTEYGRAAALADLARRAAVREAPVREGPSRAARPEVRRGRFEDTDAVCRMHARCSADTVLRRYGAPLPEVRPRTVRRMLVPPSGSSLVAVVGGEVVAVATLTPDEGDATRVGLVVEDAWQRRGLGAALLHRAALVAAERGAHRLLCSTPSMTAGVQSPTPALVATFGRAGLTARVREVGGRVEVSARVGALRAAFVRSGGSDVTSAVASPTLQAVAP